MPMVESGAAKKAVENISPMLQPGETREKASEIANPLEGTQNPEPLGFNQTGEKLKEFEQIYERLEKQKYEWFDVVAERYKPSQLDASGQVGKG
jgi:hypothetical protein